MAVYNMKEANQIDYLQYLQGISWKGRLFRKYFLYPKLNKLCDGAILDIGCGTGQFLDFLNSPRSRGVDVNEHCVNFCLSKNLQVSLMNPDELPFHDNIFDTIVLDNVLEHIADPYKLVSECSRVLVEGGRLIIGVPGTKGFLRDIDHKKFYELGDIYNLGIQTGFFPKSYFHSPFGRFIKNLNSFCIYVELIKVEN